MSSLDTLIQRATVESTMTFIPKDQLTARSKANLTDEESEAERMLRICNACRYCEGFCAVFPAMFRRLEFGAKDIHYLANLCHQCGACLHGCQYAPPMAFGINIPQAMQRVRAQTWTKFAWPRAFGVLYKRNGVTISVAVAASLALLLAVVQGANGSLLGRAEGGFYGLMPHNLMVALFAPVFLWAVLALSIALYRFWKDDAPGDSTTGAVVEAGSNVLTLKYLGGGHGDGCNNADDGFSLTKRRFHHATFYGFMLCFAATSIATLYHYVLGIPAPYNFTTLPKILGVVGGALLVVGTSGLLWMHHRRDKLQAASELKGMDRGFITLLLLTGATGLALAAMRGQPGLPLALAVHLGCVMALFLTMPYSKFAHGFYRGMALLKWNIEKRQPSKLTLAGD